MVRLLAVTAGLFGALVAASQTVRADTAPATTARIAVLDPQATMTRIAFGSCNRQDREQGVWPLIAGMAPQVFLALGDNVYADIGWDGGQDLESFRAAYEMQAGHRQFRAFRERVPVRATWDDHDYGANDGGGDFAYKSMSEVLFEDFWHSEGNVRSRPGVYQSFMAGPKGWRVQVILLDTRYFRSPLRKGVNGYEPQDDPGQSMLGEPQWKWLERELARPADLRIIGSSIQVLSEAHRFEKWANLPRERERLLRLIGKRAGGGVALLSGDRHMGALYSTRSLSSGEEIAEATSSSLNSPTGIEVTEGFEPDPMRRSQLYAGANFGLVDIDWGKRIATLRLVSDQGFEVASRQIAF